MIGIRLKELIDKYGKEITFKSQVRGSYDPSTSSNTNTTTNYTVKGYFHNYNLRDIDGTKVLAGDRRLVIPTEDTSGTSIPEPDNDDSFTGEGDEVTVKGVTKIMSGDNLVCYICQVRE